MIAADVSVVVAVRDGGEELHATLDSVLQQEGPCLEVIVVDDGSRDGSIDRVRARAALDRRIRLVSTGGAGLTAALRAGCGVARAPLVARQDSGDVSLPGRFQRQAAAFSRYPNLSLASCFTECHAPRGEFLYRVEGECTADQERSLFPPAVERKDHLGPTSHGSAMFRRDLYERVGGYRLEFPLAQDWDLWLRLGEQGTYLTVGEVLYRRILSADSISFRSRDLQLAFGEVSTEASQLRRRGVSEEAALSKARNLAQRWSYQGRSIGAKARALGHYHFGEILRRQGDPAASYYLRTAVRSAPWLLRGWIRLAQQLLARRSQRIGDGSDAA